MSVYFKTSSLVSVKILVNVLINKWSIFDKPVRYHHGMHLLGSLVVNGGSMTITVVADFDSSGQPMLPHCVYIFESSPKQAVDLGYDANSSTHVYTLDYLT